MFRSGPFGINSTKTSWVKGTGASVLAQMRRPIPRRIQKTAIVLLTLSFIGNNLQDDGPKRAFQFWKSALPIYLHYQYANFEARNDSERDRMEKLNKLHERYAPEVEAIVLRLRGFYLKCAQFAGLVNCLPRPYQEVCERMQHQVPSMFIPGDIEFILNKNLKILSPSQVFSRFDKQPLGTASIGQVHLATLRENGDTVAVKVMGFRQEIKFRKDLQQMLLFSNFFFPQFAQALMEIEAHFDTEFDYREEAKNLLEVRNNLAKAFPTVFVPKPYLRYCTKEVLVMEYVEGPNLIEGILERFEAVLPQEAKLAAVMDEEQRLQRRAARIHAMIGKQVKEHFKSRPGVVLSVVKEADEDHHHRAPQVKSIDVGKILDLLGEVHAHEIFTDGAFSSDSHPGNVILMKNNHLGLIDFGQFKRISLSARLIIARIIVALANEDEVDVVKTLHSAGYTGSPQNCYALARVWFDKQTPDALLGAANVLEFMLRMQREEGDLKTNSSGLPEDVVLACRASQMMRSVGSAFGIELSIAKLWEPHARALLKQHGIIYEPKPTRFKQGEE